MRKLVTPALAVAVAAAAVFAAVPAEAGSNALKDVMKKMGAASSSDDAAGTVALFEQTKAAAKPDYPNWAAIAEKGRAAAAKGTIDKSTCKDCHDQYRTDYKNKYGSKAP